MRARLAAVMAASLVAVVPLAAAHGQAPGTAPACAPGGAPVTFAGTAMPADAKTYLALEFDVAPGTTRVEAAYSWTDRPGLPSTPLTATTFDLGLWDADGLGTVDGFLRVVGQQSGATGQPVVFVQQDVAARGYRPAPIEPGSWWFDLGIAANLTGADWTVSIICSAPVVGAAFAPDPVDPADVADPDPGWYDGDMHMHGYHSNANAPEWQEIVDRAEAEGLDFLPITDYVTGQHWDELGPVQRANPDVVIWPGREIITYFGHANAIGETRSVLDYRHGFPGVSLADIQDLTLADGALFQVNHPDTFAGPLFENLCRGCAFQLGGVIDWDRVDTIEVLTGPVLAASTELGLPGLPVMLENPFMQPAIDRWEGLLRAGYRITGVSGSDSKGVDTDRERQGYGSSATSVYAESLSRPALAEALRAGYAYVRTQGADEGPTVEFTAVAPDGSAAMFGDSLVVSTATFTATVRGGQGQLLEISRDGELDGIPVPIQSDPFTYSWTGTRSASSGPLGTFYRVDTRELLPNEGAALTIRTTIGNPIFLSTGPSAPSAPSGPSTPGATTPPTTAGTTAGPGTAAGGAGAGRGTLPATGGAALVPLLVAAGLVVVGRTGVRLRSRP